MLLSSSSLFLVSFEPCPTLPFSSACAEQKARALTQIFERTPGQLWLQTCAGDGSHWTWCSWHMEAIKSHLGHKGHDALHYGSQSLKPVWGVWCCAVLSAVWTQLMVLSRNPWSWPIVWDCAGLGEILGIPDAFKSQKESGFGVFLCITGWIQRMLGIYRQKSSPVCSILPLAEGSTPSAQGKQWSWISMVISLLLLRALSHLWEEQSWDRRPLTHLPYFTFDLAVILLIYLKVDGSPGWMCGAGADTWL